MEDREVKKTDKRRNRCNTKSFIDNLYDICEKHNETICTDCIARELWVASAIIKVGNAAQEIRRIDNMNNTKHN